MARIMEQKMPDGTYTIKANTLKPLEYTTGYYVGLYEGTYLKLSRQPHPETVKTYARLFNKYMSAYVGLWTDEDGTTHLDPSVWLQHLDDALLVAKKHNQLAIWDIENMKAIYLE